MRRLLAWLAPPTEPHPLLAVQASSDIDRLIDAAWQHMAAGERVDAERAVCAIAALGPDATWRLLAWCASATLAVTHDLPSRPEWDDAGWWAATFVHAYDHGMHGPERALLERLHPRDQHERAVALLDLAVTACTEVAR